MAGRVYVGRRVHHVPMATLALREVGSPMSREFRRGGTIDEIGENIFSEAKGQ